MGVKGSIKVCWVVFKVLKRIFFIFVNVVVLVFKLRGLILEKWILVVEKGIGIVWERIVIWSVFDRLVGRVVIWVGVRFELIWV